MQVRFGGPPGLLDSARLELRKLTVDGSLQLHERVDLRAWSALGIGGSADMVIRCNTEAAAVVALEVLAVHGLPWLVIGSGSRLVFPDRGIRVPVISLGGRLAGWELDIVGVEAGAAVRLDQLFRVLDGAGLEAPNGFAVSRGSLGGWLQHVAKSDDGNELTHCSWVRCVRPGQQPVCISLDELEPPSKRQLGTLRSPVLLSARFELEPALRNRQNSAFMRPNFSPVNHRRNSTAVFSPSSNGDSVETLLRGAGCGGLCVRTARTHEDDPNRLVAGANTRAEDVLDLCRQLIERVELHNGCRLSPLLQFVDEDGAQIPLAHSDPLPSSTA